MGDEPTIDDYIEEYNLLRYEYNVLQERYRELQKKFNRLVAEKGDVFTDCNNCEENYKKLYTRYEKLQECYNKIIKANDDGSTKLLVVMDLLNKAWQYMTNEGTVFERQNKLIKSEFIERYKEFSDACKNLELPEESDK